ncbi:hypothetical protein EJB05_35293, partial [Eragrostis curvula]
MQNNTGNTQPPPGYPAVGSEQQGGQGAGAGERKKKVSTTKRGEGSFIEGCESVPRDARGDIETPHNLAVEFG